MTKQIKELPTQLTKILTVKTEVVKPTEDQLAKIRPFLLRDFPIDELYVRRMYLANDQPDRAFERFDEGYLRRFAKTIIGKSVLVGHEHGTAPVGRFFDAGVGLDEQGWRWVIPWFYMPQSPGNQLARDNIDSGVWAYVSIGADVDFAGLICDICGQKYYPWLDTDESNPDCPHILGKEYDGRTATATWTMSRSNPANVEAVEGSIVYLGCQYDAAIAKSAGERDELRALKETQVSASADEQSSGQIGHELNNTQGGNKTMDWETRAKELEAENTSLKEVADTVPGLEARIAELEPKAKAGDAYRDHLKGEIVRIGTLLDEQKGAEMVAAASDDVDKLKECLSEYESRWDAKRPPAGKGEVASGIDAEKKVARPGDARSYSVL